MQKIKLIALKKREKKLLEIMQHQGVMEVSPLENTEMDNERRNTLHRLELDIANLDFAIKLISPYEKKRGLLEGPLMMTEEEIEAKAKDYNFSDIVKECQDTEVKIVENRNDLSTYESEEAELLPWKNLTYKLDQLGEMDDYKVQLGVINKLELNSFMDKYESLSKYVSAGKSGETETLLYIAMIFEKELESKVKELSLNHKITLIELALRPGTAAEELEKIAKQRTEAEKNIEKLEGKLQKLAKESESLKIAHDYYIWQRDSILAQQNFSNTEYSFAATGWVPLSRLGKLEKAISKETKDFEIFRIEKEEGEDVPVIIRNKGLFGPFESITRIYGLPLANEVDPTPFLAAFFIVFFALCLTDAGYGLILFALTFAALKFIKIPKQSQGLIKLIMVGGIFTFVAGILFGGWFGMTPEQAPDFLTYAKTIGEGETLQTIKEFKWQIINPSKGTGPLTFLVLAGILGVIQVLFGITIDGYWKLRHKKYLDALLDSGLWLYFLGSIILFALSKAGVFMPHLAPVFTNMTLVGVGLVILTQGRKQKNIILKLMAGVLSLYGLVGYLADVLSYSRLMALGLGTGIIGFAMNTMAGLVSGVPYVGIVFAIIVILIGHTLNIAISTLGAFIHSSRLQFVEFFGKFMEGGGKEFKPFRKDTKYVYIVEK
ncbi:MAG: V-type ATP synthase subunit I [Patescibacteria group bacterium]|nr:V-type ATP synthase subunit I [Patescibacteria group bacterium]